MEDNRKNILEVKNLHTYFYTDSGVVKSVDGVDFELKEGSTLGIVGESGSGKSVTSLSIMGLLTGTTGKIAEGEILLEGKDIAHISEEEKRKLRGSQISMIFQEPMTSLNPVMKIGKQLTECILQHQDISKEEAWKKAEDMLRRTGVPRVEHMMKEYPFQLSGGQRQRVMIAMALVCGPKILIADEPTTALDVTIQAQILELINDLKTKRNLSIIFITHDLGVVANMADRIAVMYAGKIVELGTSEDVFYSPAHPYTWALLSAMPDVETNERLEAIPGTPPNMIYPPVGDAFADRNKYALQIDFEMQPPMFRISDTHQAATWLLHPDAPKVEIPKAITDRIARMKAKGGTDQEKGAGHE